MGFVAPTLVMVALLAGAVSAAPPPDEATALALQGTRELRPGPVLVATCGRMLAAARERAPELASLRATLPWSPDKLLVTSSREGGAATLAALAGRLPPFVPRTMFGTVHVLSFEEALNVPRLAELAREVPGVASAEPDLVVGAASSVSLHREDPPAAWRLTFFRGSGDCPAGCIEKSFWDFRFDGEGNLLSGGPRGGGSPVAPEGAPGAAPGLGIGIGLPAPGQTTGDPSREMEFPSPERPPR